MSIDTALYFIYEWCYIYRSNKNVTLFLAWNVIPNAGMLPKIWGHGSHRVAFPDEYTASKFWYCLQWTVSLLCVLMSSIKGGEVWMHVFVVRLWCKLLFCLSVLLVLLSTHADRQGVDMSFTVCVFLFVFMVTDISAEDEASGVKFCTAVLQSPWQGIPHFGELCSSRSPKSDKSASVHTEL